MGSGGWASRGRCFGRAPGSRSASLSASVVPGEFQLRLRQLEKSLLQALNEVKGRILDDDTIITTLENLKREAAEVTRKVEETDIVMQEVETVSQQYLPLSTACSSIYFTMESLKQVTAQQAGASAGRGHRLLGGC